MPTLTFAEIAAMTGGEVVQQPDVTTSSVVIDSRQVKPDSVFFISLTHATDSTSTGWRAQSAAPSHAPCTRKLRKTRHSNIAQAPCNKTVTR